MIGLNENTRAGEVPGASVSRSVETSLDDAGNNLASAETNSSGQGASGKDTHSSESSACFSSCESTFMLARKARGRGKDCDQSTLDRKNREEFQKLCDEIKCEVRELEDYISGDDLSLEGYGAVAEIQAILERLYDCPFGPGDALKSIVVAVQSQLNNAKWTHRHVSFLSRTFDFLSPRYQIEEDDAKIVMTYARELGLDPFRGTVGDSDFVHRYQIVRVADDGSEGER